MDMVMVQQGLAPSVQDGRDTQLGTEVIAPKAQEGRGAAGQEQGIEGRLVLLMAM